MPILRVDAAEDFSSLFAQIEAANRAGGSSTITLTANITLSEPLPEITSDITIEGKGYTIDGAKRFRIFEVDGGQLQLRQVTLRNGSAQGENGGAIRLRNGAVLNVSEVNFSGNSAEYGTAIGADNTE